MTRRVFTGGQVLDGTGSPAAPADVAVQDGRVVEVGTGLDGDEQVDCTGATLLPGLFDCHVHVLMSGVDTLRQLQTPYSQTYFEAVGNLRRTLALGITSVRDAAGADLGVAEAVRTGLVPGPRMQISIAMISQTGGHADDWHVCGADTPLLPVTPGRPSGICDGPDEMRRTVRLLVRAGADVLKVATSGGVLSPRDDPRHAHFRPAELAVLVEEAEAAGLAVMAHAQGADGIKNAVRAGIRSIEHGIYLDDEAIDLMLRHGTWLVPTLSAPRAVLAAVAAGAALPEAVVAKARAVQDVHDASVTRAVEAGVRVAMGTDSGVGRHGDNLGELALMARCGMSPEQAWHATTQSAAQLLRVDDELGTLEPGKRADVVVLTGDPADLGGLAGRVREVWQDGVPVARDGRVVDVPAA
ncbi:amidohydrolase family protein [Modestobacter sp. I12A-02628]|uniref:Amidohydrolase family protein n=1 Tax=Goekera deserti TaxID=2497753 RepID=A0A7K3WDK5_9ACTN|nr:amidohydrolase family protein [Goekera deserti]MPQ96807.1 amidohydrolase family protein [Goekera deserti]NDI46879.1 amidohydrolase family protein [Goekera deserti]NEL54447.1 amidohydrolase family protein [Goekera deserti]